MNNPYLLIIILLILLISQPTQARVNRPTLGVTSRLMNEDEGASSTTKSHPVKITAHSKTHLACLTAYWCTECDSDSWTASHQSSTGIHLRQGHCAVDPRVIPYGSVVQIPGVGNFLAVDTGSAVISRRAARLSGKNSEERQAVVIDLFFRNTYEAERFQLEKPKFAPVTWWEPTSKEKEAIEARKQFEASDWQRLQTIGML